MHTPGLAVDEWVGEGGVGVSATGAGAVRLRGACKVVLVLVLVGLAVFSIVSHFVPVALGFKALVIGVPCVLAVAVLLSLFLLDRGRLAFRVSLKAIARHAMGTLTWVILAVGATGIISGSLGNSTGCPAGVSGVCYKNGSWAIRDGRYYRLYPFDAQGDRISDAAWVQISKDEYTAGAGADFRGADDFGIWVAVFAYLLIVGREASTAKYAADRADRIPLQIRETLPHTNPSEPPAP